MKKFGWISRILLISLVFLFNFLPPGKVAAQDTQPAGPVYIVQSGDTLWDVALRFGVSLDELANANGLATDSQLKIGDQLIIPGMQGVQGTLTTQDVPFGETLLSMSRQYGVSVETLQKLNHISIPEELYAGSSLVVPGSSSSSTGKQKRAALAQGQSLLELALTQKVNPWTIVATNSLSGTWKALPGDVLYFPGEAQEGPGAFPGQITSIKVNPIPMVQGKTTVIEISSSAPLSVTGSLAGYTLHFFPDAEGKYIALQGVHAMTKPGVYPLALSGMLAGSIPFGFQQNIYVKDGGYYQDTPLEVPPETMDPAVTRPEDNEWMALAAPATPVKYWDGAFDLPVKRFTKEYCLETNDCWPSYYGSRRSYNGSDYIYFHTGLDVYAPTGTELYAAAPGVVVFAGPLTVRGNATMIDHGWGVYSAYMHQSEIKVQVGDHVQAGQLIGLTGSTGRVQGPHLHFEILVGGVQVQPLDWLSKSYP